MRLALSIVDSHEIMGRGLNEGLNQRIVLPDHDASIYISTSMKIMTTETRGSGERKSARTASSTENVVCNEPLTGEREISQKES